MFRKIAIAGVLAVASSGAMAEPTSGSSELELFGNYFNFDGNNFVNINVAYGYYFNSQTRMTVGLNASGNDLGDSDITLGSRAGVAYHFKPTGNTGYVSGNWFVGDLEEISDTQAVDTFLGYRSYLSENTALFYELGYRYFLDPEEGAVVGNIGITVLFD